MRGNVDMRKLCTKLGVAWDPELEVSTISGLASVSDNASLITGENSRSVSSTLASPCSRMKARVRASRRMLREFSTPPIIGMP